MYPWLKPREGFSMKINGVHLTRPELHNLAADLGIMTRDVLIKNGVLTIYNTSETCQEIIDDNALVSFVSMVLEIPIEDISEFKEVVEEIVPLELDLDDEDEEDL
jgi:hypothetical protein